MMHTRSELIFARTISHQPESNFHTPTKFTSKLAHKVVPESRNEKATHAVDARISPIAWVQLRAGGLINNSSTNKKKQRGYALLSKSQATAGAGRANRLVGEGGVGYA
jgi:hypothetical protein